MTTGQPRRALLVASGGGRVSELLQLRARMVGFDEYIWAVPDSPQSRSAIEDETIRFIPQRRHRSVRAAVRTLGPARRLIDEVGPAAVISTGASAAVPFLLEAARRKIPAHFIESVTYRAEPSVSGKFLSRIPGVMCHTQYPDAGWAGWYTVGSPFAVYKAVDTGPRPFERVVVTLGTVPNHGFRALVEKLMVLLPEGADVLWQTGSTDTRGLEIDNRQFMQTNVLHRAVADADLIIGHAGVGTALDAIASGKVPVLVPRRAHRGEHVDDHQVQIAGWLARSGLAIASELDPLSMAHLERAMSRDIVRTGDLPTLCLHGGAVEDE